MVARKGDGIMDTLPRRKQIRLKHYDYASAGAYFVTICTHERRCLLADIIENNDEKPIVKMKKYGEMAAEGIDMIQERYHVEIDVWTVMPNHIHMIVVLGSRATTRVAPTGSAAPSLGRIIGAYKSLVDHLCRKEGLTGFLWQRNYYEHVIRSEKEFLEIQRYIKENSLRWKEDKLYCARIQ